MAHSPLPPADYLRECLKYDSRTGALTWRKRPRGHFETDGTWRRRNTKFSDKPVGWKQQGGIAFGLDDGRYLAHRIIWRLRTGTDPGKFQIDHRNRDPWDNRWANLRLATQTQNSRNTLGRSKYGLPKGVTKRGGRYSAGISLGGQTRNLGSYATLEEASAVYRAFARSLHGRFYADPTQT